MDSQSKEVDAVAEQFKTVMKVSDKPDSGMTGLDECREMDKQLAEMASAGIADIPGFVLEEIFQFVDLFKLLKLRRCSKKWQVVISRESAPHLRSVVLALDADIVRTLIRVADLDYSYNYSSSAPPGKSFVNFWQFAKQPTTLIVVFEPPRDTTKQSYVEVDKGIRGLWWCYSDKGVSAGRTRLIDKVIYANLNVSGMEFRCTSVCRVGVRTVLHNCVVDLSSFLILQYEIDGLDSDDSDDDEDHGWINCFTSSEYGLNVTGTDSFVLDDQDLDRDLPSLAMVQMIKRNAKAPTLEEFIEGMQDLKYPKYLPDLLSRFVSKFDPGNNYAFDSYMKGDMSGFVAAAHPLVSSLMHFAHRIAKYYLSDEYCKGDDSSVDESDYYWYNSD